MALIQRKTHILSCSGKEFKNEVKVGVVVLIDGNAKRSLNCDKTTQVSDTMANFPLCLVDSKLEL